MIIFDGVCNLCNGTIQFIIARDPSARFQFATLGSDVAQRLLGNTVVPDSVVLIEDGQVYTKSTAALRIAKHLRFPWPIFAVLLIVPAFLRNMIYDVIARHRYQWFGKQDACMLPTPALRARFLS